MQTLSGPGAQSLKTCEVDAAGNAYVVGTYSTGSSLSGVALPHRGNRDVVVAKYSPQGQLLWVRTGGGSDDDEASAVLVDAAGNVYVGGASYRVPASFGAFPLTRQTSRYQGFIVKYNAQGVEQWVQPCGARVNDLAFAANGDLLAAGGIDYLVRFPDGTMMYPTPIAQYDASVLRMTPQGGLVSGIRIGQHDLDMAQCISTDASGAFYVAGNFSQTVEIGTTTFTTPDSQADAFVAKFNAQGVAEWAWRMSGASKQEAYGLAVDSTGNVYVGGSFYAQASYGTGSMTDNSSNALGSYLARLTPQGTLSWVRSGSGPSQEHISDVTCDAAGNVYVTGLNGPGSVFDTHTFGGTTLQGHVLCYNALGVLQWVNVMPQGSPNCVISDGSGRLWIAGGFTGSAAFPPLAISSVSGADGMLAVLGTARTSTRRAALPGPAAFPNPTRERLRIESGPGAAGPATVRLLNALGQPVRTLAVRAGQQGIELSVAGLPAGWYAVQWQDAAGLRTSSVLVQ